MKTGRSANILSGAKASCWLPGDAVTRRLVWKQYRVMRGFWVSIAILAASVQGLLILWAAVESNDRALQEFAREGVLLHAGMLLAALYALGASAAAFATEHETGTYDFQRVLPVTPGRLFWSNLLFVAASTIALFVVVSISGLTFVRFRMPEPQAWPVSIGIWGTAAVELTAWGLLASLLLRQPLQAATTAVLVASVVSYVITAANVERPWSPVAYVEQYIGRLPFHYLMAALVTAVAFWKARRWFDEEVDDRAELPIERIGFSRSPRHHHSPAVGRLAGFGRLVWQTYRQSRWEMLVVVALVAPLAWALVIDAMASLAAAAGLTIWQQDGRPSWFPPTVALAVVAPLVAGACVFMADKRQDSYRFMTERGVEPRKVWLARHAAWFSVVALCGVAVLLLLAAPLLPLLAVPVTRAIEVAVTLKYGALWLILAPLAAAPAMYCVGQFFSLAFRATQVSVVFSLLFSILTATWAVWSLRIEVPWLWSVLPIPIVFLCAAWLRVPGWMTERHGMRHWRAPLGVLLGYALAVLVGVALWRAYQIPLVEPGFSVRSFLRPRTAEEEATVAMYEKARRSYTGKRTISTKTDEEGHAIPLSAIEVQQATNDWLDANADTIRWTLAATRRNECDALKLTWGQQWPSQGKSLGELLVESALRELETEDVAGSLDHLLAALRLAQHMRPRFYQDRADDVERLVYSALMAWAAAPGQTSRQIEAALRRLREVPVNIDRRSDSIKARYAWLYRMVADDARDSVALLLAPTEKDLWTLKVTRALPWERARVLRVLNRLTLEDLQRFEKATTRVHNNSRAEPSYFETAQPFLKDRLHSTPLLDQQMYFANFLCDVEWEVRSMLSLVCLRRSVEIRLALAAWQLEHGRLPDSLERLVPRYFADLVPKDPYGDDFAYLPKGFPLAIGLRESERVKAHEPFIWSVGERVAIAVAGSDKVLDRYQMREGRTGDALRDPVSEHEIWQSGLAFPIPQPLKQPAAQ